MHLNTQACTDQLAQLGGTSNYEADYLWSYELGLKTQLFDRHLSVEGSVYHINWSNIISAVQVPLCATHISKNLGDAKSDGFDLSLKALLSQSFTAGLYVGYTNARYSSDSAIFGETLARSGQAISDIAPWDLTAELMYQATVKPGVIGYWAARGPVQQQKRQDGAGRRQHDRYLRSVRDDESGGEPAEWPHRSQVGHRVRPGAGRDKHSEHAPPFSTSRST